MNPRQTRTHTKQRGKALFVIAWAPRDTCGPFGLRGGAGPCPRQVTGVCRVVTQPPLRPGVPQPRREPRAVPEAGPQGSSAIPTPAQLSLNGAAVEKPLPAVAGGRPGTGGVRGAAQGSHYPGVIAQPSPAQPGPSGSPGQSREEHSKPRQVLPRRTPGAGVPALSQPSSVPQFPPGQSEPEGLRWRTKVFSPCKAVLPPHSQHTRNSLIQVRTEPGAAQTPGSCDSALFPLSAQRL